MGRLAQTQGAELVYFGSLRGQEGAICQARGHFFEGFPSEPLWSLKTLRGWRASAQLLRSIGLAKKRLVIVRPDVIFSTGGYSAAPVVAAARSLGIPYCIHEANSIPGRTNKMFGRQAHAFTTTFRKTGTLDLGFKTERTGQPVRQELRDAASGFDRSAEPTILVVGGSQGSAFLNETVPAAVRQIGRSVRVIHAAGKLNAEATATAASGIPGYEVVPYLDGDALIRAFRQATVAVGRSGGTLAEFALFGLPSVLVPLPSSADDHQLHNALEFEQMGAATVLRQSDASPSAMASALAGWIDDADRSAAAAKALGEWDVPDATQRIVDRLYQAAKR